MAEDDKTAWAWVTLMPSGKISLVGMAAPGFPITPMITHDKAMIGKMRPIAEAHARASGQKTWLRRYVVAEEMLNALNH